MLEVKINKEIQDVKEKVFFGLTLKQAIYSALACGASVAVFFSLRDSLETETLTLLCMLVAAPFAFLGFATIQGMSAEKFLLELIKSYIVSPKEVGNIPSNSIVSMIENYESNTEESKIKRTKELKTKSLKLLGAVACVMLICLGINIYKTYNPAYVPVSTVYTELSDKYPSEYYREDEWVRVNYVLQEFNDALGNITSKDGIANLVAIYDYRLSLIKTNGQMSAEEFKNQYAYNYSVNDSTELKLLLDEIAKGIAEAKTQQEVADAYSIGIQEMDSAIYSNLN